MVRRRSITIQAFCSLGRSIAMAGGKGKRCASEDTDDSLALRLVDLLNDDQVVAKLRAALYPTELRDEVREISKQVAILTSQLAEKNACIKTLEDKVDALEYDHDAVDSTAGVQTCACKGSGRWATVRTLTP